MLLLLLAVQPVTYPVLPRVPGGRHGPSVGGGSVHGIVGSHLAMIGAAGGVASVGGAHRPPVVG